MNPREEDDDEEEEDAVWKKKNAESYDARHCSDN